MFVGISDRWRHLFAALQPCIKYLPSYYFLSEWKDVTKIGPKSCFCSLSREKATSSKDTNWRARRESHRERRHEGWVSVRPAPHGPARGDSGCLREAEGALVTVKREHCSPAHVSGAISTAAELGAGNPTFTFWGSRPLSSSEKDWAALRHRCSSRAV